MDRNVGAGVTDSNLSTAYKHVLKQVLKAVPGVLCTGRDGTNERALLTLRASSHLPNARRGAERFGSDSVEIDALRGAGSVGAA